jgi:uncharacterized protein GlcG (DUF336 family)
MPVDAGWIHRIPVEAEWAFLPEPGERCAAFEASQLGKSVQALLIPNFGSGSRVQYRMKFQTNERESPMITLSKAREIIAAAEKKATEIGQPMNIAVADEGGNLIAHVRMDGAWIGSIDISIKKAYTSRAFDIATKDLATHSQSGSQFFGIHASNDGRIMIFAGGIPLKKKGKVQGAIGVSGGSGEQDHAVAEAGAAAF